MRFDVRVHVCKQDNKSFAFLNVLNDSEWVGDCRLVGMNYPLTKSLNLLKGERLNRLSNLESLLSMKSSFSVLTEKIAKEIWRQRGARTIRKN